MSRTYIVAVHVAAPDDVTALIGAGEVSEHIADHYRHNMLAIQVMAPERGHLADPFTIPQMEEIQS